jgi:choline/ethanolamine kinase
MCVIVTGSKLHCVVSIRRWLEEARGRCSAEECKEFRLESLGDEIADLEKALSVVDQGVVFCHNDLQYGNIMIYEETRQVTLIVSSSF